ncbi:MAG: transcription-repair coupling factor, partial [Sciscionella sp.]
MTSSPVTSHTAPGSNGAPTLRGLLATLASDPALRSLIDAAGVATLRIQGATAARPLVVAAVAGEHGANRPVLVVTATEREAEELADVLGELLHPDQVACLPSWETLPHEKLSPRADTVGRRLAVLHRLAHPGSGSPLRVLTATVRSFIQPMAPGLADLDPLRLTVGVERDFADCVTRLTELAYTRVDMVEKRGEFAVR